MPGAVRPWGNAGNHACGAAGWKVRRRGRSRRHAGTVGGTGDRSATTSGWRIVCSKWRYLSNWNNTTDRSTLVPVGIARLPRPAGRGRILVSRKTRDLGAMPGVGAGTRSPTGGPMSADELPARDAMEFDVVIVGAGPAGLAAAIRLKQLSPETSVVVVEKGSEVGAHILSGAVIDPIGLDRLIPDWRNEDSPIKTKVSDDRFYWLSSTAAMRLPSLMMPPLMNNHGNYIVSLGNVCRWLATKAEALGVEIYPGFAASEVLFDDNGAVVGVATGDMGVAKDGHHKDSFTRGMELRAKYTLFAEGARGNLSKTLLQRFGLDQGREPQKFGLGLKELWQVAPEKHRPGLAQHTFGWPLDSRTGGGSFLYHLDDNLVAVGFVVHLNYENPYLTPFEEFQRFKTHPLVRGTFEGGKRLAYGARALTEGGWQSVPKLAFPGGALLGCAAGFMNVPRIKGSHNAMLSGMLAAEYVAAALKAGRANDELAGYEAAWRSSAIGPDLWKVRNAKPLWSRLGTLRGVALAGMDMWTNSAGFSLFGTLAHGKPDFAPLKPAAAVAPLVYQ